MTAETPSEESQQTALPPESSWLVDVQNVSKKYCRDLRRSLWYGLLDVLNALMLRKADLDSLRESEFWAVRDISIQLRPGDALGLLGRNGAGKSTLIKMITGQRSLSSGTIRTRGRMVALTELGLGFDLALTGRENVYINAAVYGFTRRQTDAILEQIIEFSGIREFIDASVQSYSSGMRARLGFSVATHLSPDVLVVDEVLAVGDLEFRRKCVRHVLDYIRQGGSMILVAHDPYLVQSICNRCIVLDRGRMIFEGSGIEGVNFHFHLGHSKQFHSLLESEGILGSEVALARAEGSSDEPRHSPVVLTVQQPIVIDDIRVLPMHTGEILTTGGPARVVLNCRCLGEQKVLWGFTICTADLQTNIFSSVKSMDGGPPDLARDGEDELTAILPELPLMPGVYGVRGGVGDPETFAAIATKGYEDAPSFFTVVAKDSSRAANFKMHTGDLITTRTEWPPHRPT